jgi:hypothetical protein
VLVDVAQAIGTHAGDMAEAVIRFEAIVYKVQTLADGGVRVTLDLPETAIPQMAMLAETKREGVPLEFTARVKPDRR